MLKSVFGFGLALVAPVALSAQGVGALGGSFGTRGMSHPLGGVTAPGRTAARGPLRQGYGGALPYGYAIYVPNYFDSFGGDYSGGSYPSGYYPSAQAAPPQVAYQAPAPPPVIINQYFAAPPMPPPQALDPSAYQAAQTGDQKPGDPIGPADNYYLIAYKNHSVYTALAYWVEDKTLNYVTTENTHNQASLDLIDLDLTKTLNQARNVPFAIPGK